MYSNIPVKETKQILDDIITRNSIDPQAKNETLNWYEIITKQNYFMYNDNIILQEDGLAMGAPSSSIISEIFLQHLEHTKLPSIAKRLELINYFRCVDDILIIFDTIHTDINTIINDFNSIHPKLQFTDETEQDDKINYLDRHS